MPRVQTPNQGAGDTRRQIAKIIVHMMAEKDDCYINGADLLKMIATMPVRAAAKKGGLGRR